MQGTLPSSPSTHGCLQATNLGTIVAAIHPYFNKTKMLPASPLRPRDYRTFGFRLPLSHDPGTFGYSRCLKPVKLGDSPLYAWRSWAWRPPRGLHQPSFHAMSPIHPHRRPRRPSRWGLGTSGRGGLAAGPHLPEAPAQAGKLSKPRPKARSGRGEGELRVSGGTASLRELGVQTQNQTSASSNCLQPEITKHL